MSTPTASTLTSPEILVVGSGAIGCYYGGRLSQAGARVSLVCRSDYSVVSHHGVGIKSTHGDFQFTPEKVYNSIDQVESPPDYLIVSTKVLPEIDIVTLIKPAVGPNTSLVLLQNGVEIEPPVAAAFPENEIISGLAFICVSRTQPAQVHHQDYGQVVIGTYPEGKSPKALALGELFKQGSVKCKVTSDIITARWQKLVWNAPFNPISVLGGGVSTHTILAQQSSADLARKVMEEVVRIAAADGHPLRSGIVSSNLENTKKMTPYKTSMLLDFEANRPIELEAILGNALKVAQSHQLEVPHMETLHTLLLLVSNRE